MISVSAGKSVGISVYVEQNYVLCYRQFPDSVYNQNTT
jgi:hypothetical protein